MMSLFHHATAADQLDPPLLSSSGGKNDPNSRDNMKSITGNNKQSAPTGNFNLIKDGMLLSCDYYNKRS